MKVWGEEGGGGAGAYVAEPRALGSPAYAFVLVVGLPPGIGSVSVVGAPTASLKLRVAAPATEVGSPSFEYAYAARPSAEAQLPRKIMLRV